MSDFNEAYLAPINLLTATPTQREQWLEEALPSLTHDVLIHIHQEYDRVIDFLYPDDPGALVNADYNYGQGLKKEMKQFFTMAHGRLPVAKVSYVESTRNQLLEYLRGTTADGAYASRRRSIRQRQGDELDHRIQTGLASDAQLQADLARGRASQAEAMELRMLEAEIERKATKLTAKLERARRELDRPYELILKLQDVLESLLKYQMSLNDRALRNPALADRLRMMGMGLTAVMTSVQQIMTELNRAEGAETPPDPTRVREQSEGLLAMAMEQMQQWQQESRNEPDL